LLVIREHSLKAKRLATRLAFEQQYYLLTTNY